MSVPALLKGLDWRRVAWTVGLSTLVTTGLMPFFINTFYDLLISALCVGFLIMLLVTIAGNVMIKSVPREARMMLAVVLGSIVGTLMTATPRRGWM